MEPDAQTRNTMTKTVQAVYEKGVLRPLETLNLAENERVTVTVTNGTRPAYEELLDTAFIAACAKEADPTVTLEEVREALAAIPGSMTHDFVTERDER
jgi:predicted DNA-binding antitoxin AbrB/MazE fold protein